MWCTRWFIPLLLLPFPNASPYFLILFLFSLTLHARPCFYCIILLTALFGSSCSWQPIPTRSLFQAAFPNILSSSPLFYFPNSTMTDHGPIPLSQLIPVPEHTALLDRCWFDLSGGHLFDPYNITQWQLSSLSRTLGAIKSQRVLVAQETQIHSSDVDLAADSEPVTKVWVLRMMGKDEPRAEERVIVPPSSSDQSTRNWLQSSLHLLSPVRSLLSFPFGNRPSSEATDVSSAAEPLVTSPTRKADAMEEPPLPLLRPIYDLRPHGINLVLDLRWGRSVS